MEQIETTGYCHAFGMSPRFGMEEEREFQIIGAAVWKDLELKTRLLQGTRRLVEDDDHNVNI